MLSVIIIHHRHNSKTGWRCDSQQHSSIIFFTNVSGQKIYIYIFWDRCNTDSPLSEGAEPPTPSSHMCVCWMCSNYNTGCRQAAWLTELGHCISPVKSLQNVITSVSRPCSTCASHAWSCWTCKSITELIYCVNKRNCHPKELSVRHKLHYCTLGLGHKSCCLFWQKCDKTSESIYTYTMSWCKTKQTNTETAFIMTVMFFQIESGMAQCVWQMLPYWHLYY